MSSRAVISIRSADGSSSSTVPLPAVFTAPIRSDIVQAIHKSVAKNRRQPYSVAENAGHQTSAESWGTGRAVARIPRVGGSGTGRTGQGAFGNMCRGGRMFAPTKTWRKFHVKVPLLQKRYATVSAIAASALPALVLARGHLISNVEEIPLVVGNDIEKISKTKEAFALLKTLGAADEIAKVIKSKKLRAGKGKYRGRRHRQRLGPLVVYGTDEGVSRGFKNLPGVDVCDVRHLNLLQLAPGGHLGRFVIWTEGAIGLLDELWGTHEKGSELKKGYHLPTSKLSNPDVTRLINSTEIQSIVRPLKGAKVSKRPFAQKKNPLKNRAVLFRLNPYAKVQKRLEILEEERIKKGGKARGHKAKGEKVKKEENFLKTLHAP